MQQKNKGAILLLTTILLFVILGMVVSLTYVTVMEQKMSQKTKSSVGAFYNSESGVEWALNKIANNSGTISSALTGLTTYNDGKIDCPFSGNSCSVYFLGADGKVIQKTDFGKDISEVKAVRSVGDQGGETQRAIEAAVAANKLSCVTIQGPLSAITDDATSSAQCDTANGYVVTGCSCFSPWDSCEGATADIANNKCLGWANGNGVSVYGEAICCKTN